MHAVQVDIVRFLDTSYPGFVECRLFDAVGREVLFHEKVPVVTLADLDADHVYRQPGSIACCVTDRRLLADGREIVRIDTETPWHVGSLGGETVFEVFLEQLAELP